MTPPHPSPPGISGRLLVLQGIRNLAVTLPQLHAIPAPWSTLSRTKRRCRKTLHMQHAPWTPRILATETRACPGPERLNITSIQPGYHNAETLSVQGGKSLDGSAFSRKIKVEHSPASQASIVNVQGCHLVATGRHFRHSSQQSQRQACS